MATTTRARRRYTLSLRALMILVLVVGGGIGWTVNRANGRRRAVEAIRDARGSVSFDYEFFDGEYHPAGRSWVPTWLSAHLGMELFHDVTMVTRLNGSAVPEKEASAAMAALREFDRLEMLRVVDPPPGTTFSGLDRLKALNVSTKRRIRLGSLPSLDELRLDGPGVDDALLPDLARLPSLRAFLTQRTGMTDAGLARLGDLSGLEALWLHAADVSDAGLPNLVRLKKLAILDLGGNRGVTDEGIRYLSKNLPGLTNLMVDDTQVTDAGLASLADFPRLEGFHVAGQGAKITDVGLWHVARLAHLEALNLQGTGITDAGLVHLRGLKRLRWLNLDDTAITDAGLAHLEAFPTLRWLCLGDTAITDAGLAHLSGLAGLEQLFLDGTRVTDAGLAHLSGLKSLKVIWLTNTAVTPQGAASLKAALPSAVVRSGNVGTRRPARAAPKGGP